MKRHISLTKSTGNAQVDRALDEIRRKINPVLKNLGDSVDETLSPSLASSLFYDATQTSSQIVFSGVGTTENTEVKLIVPEDGVYEVFLYASIDGVRASGGNTTPINNVYLNGIVIGEMFTWHSETYSSNTEARFTKTVVSKPKNIGAGSVIQLKGTSGSSADSVWWVSGTSLWVRKL